jgi:predicted transcriptional regulator
METKTARLTILVDPAKKRALERLCAAQDLTPSQVVRQLIRDYLTAHGVTWKSQTNVARAGAAVAGKRAKSV